MRYVAFVLVLLAGAVAAHNPALADACDSDLQKAQAQARMISDPGKRAAVEALLEHAQEARDHGDKDRCYSDVKKAQRAMSH